MIGLYEVVVLGDAREFPTKKGPKIVTPGAIGEVPVEIPGNSMKRLDVVYVHGDLRTYQGRSYFADGAELIRSNPKLPNLTAVAAALKSTA